MQNNGDESIRSTLSTRLWQQSASTLQPLGPAAVWWQGSIDSRQTLELPARLALPSLRVATTLQMQVLDAEGRLIGRLPLVAIPPGWFSEQLATLPAGLAVYDPEALLTPELTRARLKVTAMTTLSVSNLNPAALLVLVPLENDSGNVAAAARRFTAAGWPVVIISSGEQRDARDAAEFPHATFADFTGLADSASAQHRFVSLLRDALRRKAAAALLPKPPLNE